MPTVSNTQLTLTTVNSDTTITVDFDTEFNEVERNLRDLGVTYHLTSTSSALMASTGMC